MNRKVSLSHQKNRTPSILSHAHRRDQIHVLTLDSVLGKDITERLRWDPRIQAVTIIAPEKQTANDRLMEIEAMASQTISSRVIVLDVRSQTLPRLQRLYNKVVGYNRKDLNDICFMVLIGDGPMNMFHPGKSPAVFAAQLATHRRGFHPAAFFYDPFMHYTLAERQQLGLHQSLEISYEIPQRLAKRFRGGKATIADVREYFRADAVAAKNKCTAKQRRQGKLTRLFEKRIVEAFGDHRQQALSWLSKEGYGIEGEPLRLNIYPLYFEDRVAELL